MCGQTLQVEGRTNETGRRTTRTRSSRSWPATLRPHLHPISEHGTYGVDRRSEVAEVPALGALRGRLPEARLLLLPPRERRLLELLAELEVQILHGVGRGTQVEVALQHGVRALVRATICSLVAPLCAGRAGRHGVATLHRSDLAPTEDVAKDLLVAGGAPLKRRRRRRWSRPRWRRSRWRRRRWSLERWRRSRWRRILRWRCRRSSFSAASSPAAASSLAAVARLDNCRNLIGLVGGLHHPNAPDDGDKHEQQQTTHTAGHLEGRMNLTS